MEHSPESERQIEPNYNPYTKEQWEKIKNKLSLRSPNLERVLNQREKRGII